jgi:hypothetical protein
MPMPDNPEAWERLYKKLARDLALVENDWEIDVHDLVELKLNKQDHTVVIVDKTPYAVDHALARVAAVAISGLFHKHGGMLVRADPDGIHLELDNSTTCKRLVSWDEVLQLDAAESDLGQVGEEDHLIMKKEYTDLADKLEALAARCRDIAARADLAANKS